MVYGPTLSVVEIVNDASYYVDVRALSKKAMYLPEHFIGAVYHASN